MSLAILEILNEKEIKAEVSSGLSLGEYTALIYSKALDFEEGIKLVKKRGEYMQDLVPSGEWAMAAVLGMSENVVEEICKKVDKGFVVPVNFNTTGQIVISGEKQAIEQAEIIAKEMGVKKLRILNTSGPFHTEKLIDASNALRKHIISPVRFSNSLKTMIDLGVDTFIEVGPGKTLSGFVKRLDTDKEVKIFNINNVQTLENVLENM